VAGAGAGFHWISLKIQRGSSKTKGNLGRAVKKVDDHRLGRAPARLPSASSLARRLLLLPAIEFLGVLVLEKGSLDWRRLEEKRLGERLGHPRFLFMGLAKKSWPEIVLHIPRNLGGGETSLTESSSGRLEFKLSHIWLTGSVELWSDRCSGLVLFDQNCRMDRLKLLARQDRKWKVKFMVNKITRTINHLATNCLTQSNVQIL
jgi:hypothetical protein